MPCWRRRATTVSRSALRAAVSTSPTRVAFSSRSLRACLLAHCTATGIATTAVTITETTAVAQVTRMARPLSVLVICGVADAAHGADQPGGVAELAAHLGDVHVDGAGAGVRGVPPHRGQQLLPGEDPARPVDQVRE